MLDSFGAALRHLRQQRGLSLAELSTRTNISKSHLGNLENGTRGANAAVAAICDQVLDSEPLLAVMLSVERGHLMHRRLLLGGVLATASTAVVASVDGTSALAAAISAHLRTSTGEPIDWDALVDGFAHRHIHQPGPEFGSELAANLTVAHEHAVGGDRDAMRGAAKLALLYGLWVADTGRVSTAQGLYATAVGYADRSDDRPLRALVRARTASRGPYEGWTVRQASDTADEALLLSPDGAAAVEAHGAKVHLAALTGRLEDGRREVQAMYAAADSDWMRGRAATFDNYMECRTASLAHAEAAYARCQPRLAPFGRWATEATVYLGRAYVAAGNVAGGVKIALDAVRACPSSTQILGWGVRDVLSAVPAGAARSDDLVALRGFASAGVAPWETLR